jgi:hypothetical protein
LVSKLFPKYQKWHHTAQLFANIKHYICGSNIRLERLLMHRKIQHVYIGLIALLLANLLFGLLSASPAQAQNTPQWQDTGRNLPTTDFCIDSGRKDRLVSFEYENDTKLVKTNVLDLQTGQTTFLNRRGFPVCAANGVLYAQEHDDNALAKKAAYRSSTLETGETQLEHMPTFVAQDGSRYVYYYQAFDRLRDVKSVLKVSADGGKTWQERGQQFNGYLRSFIIAPSDARVAYALVQASTPQSDGNTQFSIYLSRNAGESWELRYQSADRELLGQGGIPYYFRRLPSYHTSPDYVQLLRDGGGNGSASGNFHFVSVDGAKTFSSVGVTNIAGNTSINYVTNGLLRFFSPTGSSNRSTQLDYSENGKDWTVLNLPEEVTKSKNYRLEGVPTSPNIFFLQHQDLKKIWLTTDGGKNWQLISDGLYFESIQSTPYAPTALIGVNADKRVFKLDLSQYDRIQTERARANNLSADNIYFPETGHNLNGVFRRYWEANGGLAQFGYPKTEPFPEYNPADGKIYTVQYYERNRFEYHPELAGTKYEVLLGLLGNQMTEKQRAEGHGAFNRFPNMNYPGGTYFPETGHNLRNSFKAYWEQYGGLAIYGYPTSEEYEEVNPDDGKTYVVQYFERARFEYHPENKGTKYEVLLGLLGNALLRQKAWLS